MRWMMLFFLIVNVALAMDWEAMVRQAREEHRTGNLAAAERTLRKVLEDPQTEKSVAALARCNLGLVYLEGGRLAPAEKQTLLSLDYFEKQHPDPLFLQRLRNNLASIRVEMQDVAALERMDLETIARQAVPDSPEAAVAWGNVAGFQWLRGDEAKAAEFYRKSLAILERMPVPDALQMASVRNNLGIMAFRENRYPESRVHLKAALDLWAAGAGEHHPGAARSYLNLGHAELALGNHDEALRQFSRAQTIAVRYFGDDSAVAISSWEGRGETLARMGRGKEARRTRERAAELQRSLDARDPGRHTVSYSDWLKGFRKP
ncbi:MAG: tetratricopeptide repeat protein [Bryobacter sp.]|nr:tetratricopeptide repeat protein [Bryobacter sp.]